MMTKNMKDYISADNDEIWKVLRDAMEGQREHDLYDKSFSNHVESDETDTLERRIKAWMVVVGRIGSLLWNAYDYSYNELFGSYRKALDPEMQELAPAIRDRQTIP